MLFRFFLGTTILCCTTQTFGWLYQQPTFTIMLDPAYEAKNMGRSLYNNFERGATLQFAQELKKQITCQYPHVTVVLSRTAGESLEKLQSASFANRLNVNLVLHINFYKEAKVKPQIFLYYFKNQSYFSHNRPGQLYFYPYHQAFTFNFDRTTQWVGYMQKHLQQINFKHYFECKNAIALPFRPLVGITAPAIGIEIGIKKNGWDAFLEPIVNSLAEIVYAS